MQGKLETEKGPALGIHRREPEEAWEMGLGEGGEKTGRKEGWEGHGEPGTAGFRGVGRGGGKMGFQEFGFPERRQERRLKYREGVHVHIWGILGLRGRQVAGHLYLPEPGTLGERNRSDGKGIGLIFTEHPLGARYCIKDLICVVYVMSPLLWE